MEIETLPSRNRQLTIDTNIFKVLRDAIEMKRSRSRMAPLKRKMLPPLTKPYRMLRAMRTVNNVQEGLLKNIEEHAKLDNERDACLQNLKEKCDSLISSFNESENIVEEHQKQEEEHKWLVNHIAVETDESVKQATGFRKAATTLIAIKNIVRKFTEENQVYSFFLDKVAKDSRRFSSAQNIVDRYEELMTLKEELSRKINEAVEKLKEKKTRVATNSSAANVKLRILLNQLDLASHVLNNSKSQTLKYEMAMNNINIDSVQRKKELVQVLESFETIVEKLIARKMLRKKYRKMTLAKQLEAVVMCYQTNKAIIQEFYKSEISLCEKQKYVKAAYEKFEEELMEEQAANVRLESLMIKDRITKLKNEEAQYMKRMRRMTAKSITFGHMNSGSSALFASRKWETIGSSVDKIDAISNDEVDCLSEELSYYSIESSGRSLTRSSSVFPEVFTRKRSTKTKASYGGGIQ